MKNHHERLNQCLLSAKEWIEKTNAIGMYVQAGRYGGTYAHKDIAFEFGSAISPVFKLYLLKEYQRLKAYAEAINKTMTEALKDGIELLYEKESRK